jgi:probable rRNA maturation factor
MARKADLPQSSQSSQRKPKIASSVNSVSSAAKKGLRLSVQYACNDDSVPSRQRVRRWVGAAARSDAEVTVRFVDIAEGRQLNRDYRGKDYATNVLSFAYSSQPTVTGDLVICLPVVLSEAAAQGKEVAAHFAHLIVHGMLHLQGYDHETSAAEAARMEKMEREILKGLGFADPY